MQVVSDEIKGCLSKQSMIRKMFEAGIELKKKYGADNVYDFSLGNPDLPSPAEAETALKEMAEHAQDAFAFGYMPDAGFPETRKSLSRRLSKEQNFEIPWTNIIAVCGAAGGLNAFFRAILAPGDEVMVSSPYFVEYGGYAANFGGKLVAVPSVLPDFRLNIAGFAQAITSRTRAVIINSPNNPTGTIYTREELTELADVLTAQSEKYGRPIFILSDEPYRFLNYDNVEIPCIFSVYKYSVIAGSFSKSLSLPGERAGYLAVSPVMEEQDVLTSALIYTNRVLGFVNAPVMAQKLIIACENAEVDANIYRARRAAMADVLTEAGIEFTMPKGAFYFFPKSPIENEGEFINLLTRERVLAVPGTGFGLPGYFRLAFCVSEKTIRNSMESFKRAVAAAK